LPLYGIIIIFYIIFITFAAPAKTDSKTAEAEKETTV
jgi:hypothetical protein